MFEFTYLFSADDKARVFTQSSRAWKKGVKMLQSLGASYILVVNVADGSEVFFSHK